MIYFNGRSATIFFTVLAAILFAVCPQTHVAAAGETNLNETATEKQASVTIVTKADEDRAAKNKKRSAAVADAKTKQLPSVDTTTKQLPDVDTTTEERDEIDDSSAENTSKKVTTEENGVIVDRFVAESKTIKTTTPSRVKFAREMDKVRLTWDMTPDAVMYQVVLLKDAKDTADNIVQAYDQVYTNGIEIDLRLFGDERKNFYYKVCPLNYEGVNLQPFSVPKPITDGEFNTVSPLTQSEFDRMDFAPLYPTYSWVPFLDAVQYQIRVFRRRGDDDTLIANIIATDHDVYEWSGYTHPDTYYWEIRALDPDGRAISEWSEKRFFEVTTPVAVAAFGDSITHGGGATSVPPCRVMYNWETYCPVPIKNLGRSGDTTQNMADRFDNDVLPFKPKILVIMGGVNDYREGTDSNVSIENLIRVRERCYDNDIIPVFVTPTPINAWLIDRRKLTTSPYHSWQYLRQDIIRWVRMQQYFVDINDTLTDAEGDLNGELTADGLHPDYKAKKHIGETIGKYLQEKFPHILGTVKK